MIGTSFFLSSIVLRASHSSTLRTRLTKSIPEAKATSSIISLSSSTPRKIVAPQKMGRKKSSKPQEETRTSFMFPLLHQKVAGAVSDEIAFTWFHEHDSDEDSNNKWSTNVMGSFRCYNKACKTQRWSSKVVTILIRGYPRNGYNAVVYNQRCKSCNQLGILKMDEESYCDRVTYWVKKWAGVPVKQPPHTDQKGPPHESSLCEGCKSGLCLKRNTSEYH
jgi:hypothetical protein